MLGGLLIRLRSDDLRAFLQDDEWPLGRSYLGLFNQREQFLVQRGCCWDGTLTGCSEAVLASSLGVYGSMQKLLLLERLKSLGLSLLLELLLLLL